MSGVNTAGVGEPSTRIVFRTASKHISASCKDEACNHDKEQIKDMVKLLLGNLQKAEMGLYKRKRRRIIFFWQD